MNINGRQILVDFECERNLEGWKPRRFGNQPYVHSLLSIYPDCLLIMFDVSLLAKVVVLVVKKSLVS